MTKETPTATDNPLLPNQVLIAPKFAEAQFRRTVWFVDAPHNVSLKDIVRPEFWANVAPQLTARDRIEVYDEAGTYYAELMVTQVAEKSATKPQNWAAVKLMRLVDLTKDDEEKTKALPAGFEAKYLGPVQKWGIRRLSDGNIVVDKQISRKEATEEFFRLQKQMAA